MERLRKPGWYVLSCLIFLFYLWTATSSNRPFYLRDTSQEFYNQLTDSLAQGHVYLAAKPSPQLLALPDPYDPAANERFRLHDASLYQGRYYMYFGVAPAVTLLPWRVLTGKRLSDDIAVTLFSMGGYVFSCLLLFLLLEASQMRVPWFLQGAAVLALGLGQVAPIVLRRPRVYEVALSAAYCFLLGGLYFLALRVVRPNARRWLPALAAVLLGLATASRPHCAFIALLVAIFYGFHLIRIRGLSRRPWLVEFTRFALPLAVAGVLNGCRSKRSRFRRASSGWRSPGPDARARTSKLLDHAFPRRSRRIPLNPVAGGSRVAPQPQQVFSGHSENQRHGREYDEKQQGRHHRADDAVQ
jgi:hypothetical protein